MKEQVVNKMNPEIKTDWLVALRSGKYEQGTHKLRGRDDKYCCLGVLCDVVGADWRAMPMYQAIELVDHYAPFIGDEYIGGTGALTPEFCSTVGMPNDAHTQLFGMNDHGMPFPKIADWIEENL